MGLAETLSTHSLTLCTVRMLLSKGTTIRLAQRPKINSFSILGVAREGRDKWVPNIAYFCDMVPRTQCMGHCTGQIGDSGIPIRGGVSVPLVGRTNGSLT